MRKGNGWTGRDWIGAAFLLSATAVFVAWQNARIGILWDLSYLLDTSWRMALGQMPYRDFPLVHPPLTFLIQAGIMHLAGRHYGLVIAYAAGMGGLGTVLAWRMLLRILADRFQYAWLIALILALPLVCLGVYSVYPHPIYDSDCAVAILFAIFLLQRVAGGTFWSGFFAGIFVVIPALFKQNMGMPFLLAVTVGILILLAVGWFRKAGPDAVPAEVLLPILAGIVAAVLVAVALIQVTAGLGNYLHWTVQFAAERRLPGLAEMLSVYRQSSIVWTLPAAGCGMVLLCFPVADRVWARVLAFLLLAAPFVGSLVYLFLSDDADDRADNLLSLWPMLLIVAALVALLEFRKGVTLPRLIPFFVLAAIHGTFLSQQLWGSTYSIWPLLMILIAGLLAAIPPAARWLAPALAAVVCVTFLVCGSLYAASLERLNYVQMPEGSTQRATLPALRGMADRGPYLGDFEQLVQFAERAIPPQEGILLLPGEEPFYFATGRIPQFPVQIFDNTTDPYSPEELMAEAERRNIRWVIVKTRLQSNEDPLQARGQVMALIEQRYQVFQHLAGYDVYHRR